MVGISKLYCGNIEPSDVLRYGRHSSVLPSNLLQFSADKKPVVIMNITKKCNLRCAHCYAYSEDSSKEEMETKKILEILDDLAEYGSPVVLFSGGEPLLHKDIDKIALHAVKNGLRAVVSTNGTLITDEIAHKFSEIGLSYIGISLDGVRETHNRFRGSESAFDNAIKGIGNANARGIKTGLRFTITKYNYTDIPGVFDILVENNIRRICFYHLVYTGRGENLKDIALSKDETRKIVDLIIDTTASLHKKDYPAEVLTVDNHCDSVYLYMRLLRENPNKAANVLELLRFNGGNNSGIGVSSIGWDGSVYPDQFWRNHVLGNVYDRPFSKIWTDTENELLVKLRDRKKYLKGRCSVCKYLDVCNGNFRARAEAISGDIWAPDPDCYLTDSEILKGE